MRYEFSSFLIDSKNRVLYLNHRVLTCDERMVALLVELIESYPDPCCHDELIKKLWPNTVVSQWSLARLVSDCRKFFSTVGADCGLITTVHGRGYRLSHETASQLLTLPDLCEQDVPDYRPEENLLVSGLAGTSALYSEHDQYKPFRFNQFLNKVTHYDYALIFSLLCILCFFMYSENWLESEPLIIGEPAVVKARLLWVDDHPENNRSEKDFFISKQVAVYSAASTEDALTLLGMYQYDAIITDMGRDDDALAGLKFIERVRAQAVSTPIFLYTIIASEALQNTVLEKGGNGTAVTSDALYEFVLSALPD